MSTFAPAREYLNLPLRVHDFLRNVPLYDVSFIDLPGGGDGRSLADIRALDASTRPSRIASVLFGMRRLIGKLFRWDREVRRELTMLSRLSDPDRRDSEVTPGTAAAAGAFVILYQFPREALWETINATVRGFISTALIRRADGYRFYFAVYVLPVSWLTRPYLIAIEPFRRILYPAMLRRIRRAWIAAYTPVAKPERF